MHESLTLSQLTAKTSSKARSLQNWTSKKVLRPEAQTLRRGTGTHRLYPQKEVEIAAIKTVVRSGLHYQPWPFVNAGPKVLIVNGPLRKVEGILVDSGGDYKISVGVSLLQRSVLADLGTSTKFMRVSRTYLAPQAYRP